MRLTRIRDARPRVAMISMHTSPLDQPGTGDAGGLNVYVARTAATIAQSGAEVDVFTRATGHGQDEIEVEPGVRVVPVSAGPGRGLRKEALPDQVGVFADGILRRDAPRYDVIHSHYWLSGWAGRMLARHWELPFVHTMHTMAKVKNESLAAGDAPEPLARVTGEERLVMVADRLVANTSTERDDLIRLYGADPDRIDVVHPGVDLRTFAPGDRSESRSAFGLRPDAEVILFVGRIQPLKAPDLLVHMLADLVRRDPVRRARTQVVICGGPSGSGLARPEGLARLAVALGVADRVRFLPPQRHQDLAHLYRAADLVAVPSHSESFGLVALEAQASGTPVVAAAVGGLRTVVSDRRSGHLIIGHDPAAWAAAIAALLDDPRRRDRLSLGAIEHARGFSWSATAAGTLEVYRAAQRAHAGRLLLAAN